MAASGAMNPTLQKIDSPDKEAYNAELAQKIKTTLPQAPPATAAFAPVSGVRESIASSTREQRGKSHHKHDAIKFGAVFQTDLKQH